MMLCNILEFMSTFVMPITHIFNKHSQLTYYFHVQPTIMPPGVYQKLCEGTLSGMQFQWQKGRKDPD